MAYEKSKVSRAGQGSLDKLPLVGFEYCHQVSSVPGEEISPGELAEGELALNAGDGRLLYKTPAGGVGQFPSAVGVSRIVSLAQGDYDALAVKDAGTLCVVTPNPS